ncbi:MAG: hypothetical protein HOP11_09010, partial [Saprospiraceae bacterium]|nr:hypothetical protein [Saprospiraceae bacterium]
GGVIKPLSVGQEQFKKALKDTNKILEDQTKLLKELSSSRPVDKTVIDALNTKIKEFKKELSVLKNELESLKSPKINIPKPEGFEKITNEARNVLKNIGEFAPALDKLATGAGLKFQNRISEIDGKLKIVKETITKAKGSGVTKDEDINKLIIAEKLLIEEKKKLTLQLNAEAKAFTELSKTINPTSLVGMRFELSKLKQEYSLLSEEQRNSTEGQKKFNAIVATNIKVSNLEQAQGDFRRNVGNYQTAVTNIIPILDKLKQQGKLAGVSLVDAFKAESIANVERLQTEVRLLAVDYDKLNKEQKETAAGQATFTKLTAKAHELETAMRSLPVETSKFKQGFIGLGDLITGGLITGGILAAGSALKAFGATSIQEFKQAEIAIAKIEAQLAATGNLAGKTSEQLRGLAQDIEISSGIDADTVLDQVTSKLLTFKNVQGEVFDAAQKNAINLAQVMGGDLAGAASLIGKALEDPEKSFGKLAKAGITLSETSKKQVTEALKSNDVYKAQSIILKEIESRVGGVADAINNSQLSGLRKLTVDWNNFKESIGGALISIANGVIDTGKQISDGTLFTPVGLKETKKAIDNVTESLYKEYNQIDANISAIKTSNQGSKEREIVIQQVADKYADLISKEELEVATMEDLDRIQLRLTATVREQVLERIKAQTKEAIETQIIQRQIANAYLKRDDTSKLDFLDKTKKFFLEYSYGLKDANGILIAANEKEIEALKKEKDKFEAVLNEDFPILNTNKIEANYEDAALKIKGLLKKIETAVKSTSTTDKTKAELTNISNSLLGINIDKNATQEEINEYIRFAEDKKKKISELLAFKIDTTAGDTQAQKTLDDIQKIRQRIKDLELDSINNEFDQRIAKIREANQREVAEYKKNYGEKNGLVTELIAKIGKSEASEIEKINKERNASILKSKDELLKLRDEINQTVKDVAVSGAQGNLDSVAFSLGQSERTIKIEYDVRIEDLNRQLSEGLIDKKEYDDKIIEADQQRIDKQIKVNSEYKNTTDKLFEDLNNAQKDLNEAKYKGLLLDIESNRLAKQSQLLADFRSGKVTATDFSSTALTIEVEANIKRTEAKSKFNIEDQKLDNELIKSRQETEDKLKEIADAGIDLTSNTKQSAIDRKKEEFEAIRDLAIQSAQEIADALFQINQNQEDRNYNLRSANLDREREARLKLVKGNTAEEERINREFDRKKKQLEEDNFKRQKKQAILQATINGALAVIKTFAQYGFTPLAIIAVAGQVAATLAQIAVIKSQQFAEGGFGRKFLRKSGEGGYTGGSSAPADHTGKRPVGVAMFHENEYTAPEEQVRANKGLYDAMESDRKRKMWSGSGSEVNKYLRKKAFEALLTQDRMPNILRKKSDIQIPQLYSVSYLQKSENNKLEFTEEMMILLANRIAQSTEKAIEKGVNSGYGKAVKDIAIHETRKTLQELRKAI